MTLGGLRARSHGVVDASHLASLLGAADLGQIPPIRLVAVMYGNNETGVIQPIERLAAICWEKSVPIHVDAIQAAGKLATRFRDFQISSMSVSAHKIHGPRGIGALLVRGDVSLEPRLYGGFQQGGLRPGTESIELAVGIWAALDEWEKNRERRSVHLRTLRDAFEAGLHKALPAIVINGDSSERLPHTSNVAFPGIERQAMFMALDQAGVLCSTGSACASGSSKPSPTLRAMGLSEAVVASSFRFSLGAQNTSEEVTEAVRRISDACRRLSPA